MLLNSQFVLLSMFILTITSEAKSKHSKGKKSNPGNSLWKQEYEDELNDAMLSTKKGVNNTRFAQNAPNDNDVVIEKLLDSITASEKYMKKIENMDFRLNRLDVEIHEKTNDILRRLTDLSNSVHQPENIEKLGDSLNFIKNDLEKIKAFVDKNPERILNKATADASECQLDSAFNHRISHLESEVASTLKGVETITGIISEVKNRQYPKPSVNGGGSLDPLINEFKRTIQEQRTRKCDCSRFGRTDRSERYPTDCREIQLQGFNISGIYKIKPYDTESFYVLCDLTTAGGGWTVIQSRFDGSQDFYKGWSDYKNGFGNLAGEFWLGLEKLYYLTNQKLYELRIEVESGKDRYTQEAAASYSVFTIGPEYEGFRISSLGTYRGNAGDSFAYHAGQKFSTYDADNDEWKDGACATEHVGAWWYKECDKSNLNGKFSTSAEDNSGHTIYWITFKGPNTPLTKTRIMIRPLPATRPLEQEYRSSDKGQDKQTLARKDNKNMYEGRARSPYRYDDIHADSFFPNYT